MQTPRPPPGMGSEDLPPPYSSVVSSQGYSESVRISLSPTAPYPPVITDTEQVPHPPPMYSYNSMPVHQGTTGSGIPMPLSTHNLPYTTPTIYNSQTPVVAPTSQGKKSWSGIEKMVAYIFLFGIIIVITTIVRSF